MSLAFYIYFSFWGIRNVWRHIMHWYLEWLLRSRIRTATPAPFIFNKLMDKERHRGQVDRIIEIKFVKTVTVFLLLSHPVAWLIPRILGVVLVRGRRLKEDGTYFKVKKTKQIRF